MKRLDWRHGVAAVAAVAVLAAGLFWTRPVTKAGVEHLQLGDGSPLTVATPTHFKDARVLLLTPKDQALNDSQLLALADTHGARLVQLTPGSGDCTAQRQRFDEAAKRLDGAPTLVAGIRNGASQAWRWLGEQHDDQARALSVDFSLDKPDCPSPLPQQAAHGHWTVAWNDNPDDPTARFVRGLSNADTLISDYDETLPQVLNTQLGRLLGGQGDALPVVEVPSPQHADTVTLFYSGDGGWRDLDKAVAEELAKRGYPVVGIDTLRYFWQHKSPEQGAADLSSLMQSYREKWGAKRFVLAGYSFGADVLPAIYNRLSAADRKQVDTVILLALARTGSFEIEVEGWLGKAGEEAATGPELTRMPPQKVVCVYGQEEAGESGCTQPGAVGQAMELPGGHHYDENYPALAERLLKEIQAREKPPATPAG
jgi:type IV secretory pathway VirJ component